MTEERYQAHRWSKGLQEDGAVFLAKFDELSGLWGVKIHGSPVIGTGTTSWEALIDLWKRSTPEEGKSPGP